MQKLNFQNLPNTTTPINATNLNAVQTNVENVFNGSVSAGNMSMTSVTTSSSSSIGGNLSVTGNATINGDINNKAFNYSSSEEAIGKWVNNKTIYRRVNDANVSISANSWTNLRYKSGEESIIKCFVSADTNFAGSSYPVAVKLSGNYIQICSPIALTVKSVLIEYTKA